MSALRRNRWKEEERKGKMDVSLGPSGLAGVLTGALDLLPLVARTMKSEACKILENVQLSKVYSSVIGREICNKSQMGFNQLKGILKVYFSEWAFCPKFLYKYSIGNFFKSQSP